MLSEVRRRPQFDAMPCVEVQYVVYSKNASCQVKVMSGVKV